MSNNLEYVDKAEENFDQKMFYQNKKSSDPVFYCDLKVDKIAEELLIV